MQNLVNIFFCQNVEDDKKIQSWFPYVLQTKLSW